MALVKFHAHTEQILEYQHIQLQNSLGVPQNQSRYSNI